MKGGLRIVSLLCIGGGLLVSCSFDDVDVSAETYSMEELLEGSQHMPLFTYGSQSF